MYLTDECLAEIEQFQQEELQKLQALISKKNERNELWQKEQAGLNELLRVILEESEFTINLA